MTDQGSVRALTTVISSIHTFTGQCRPCGCNITVRLTRVRGTGQQSAGSSSLLLTSATHATRRLATDFPGKCERRVGVGCGPSDSLARACGIVHDQESFRR